ncbi:hypothetical protein D3D01_20145 [Haloarcula sp. Atlit-7R]|nr:hypothetical protein D3D01_20145 [Haloarcula sp. Atlit-7R]
MVLVGLTEFLPAFGFLLQQRERAVSRRQHKFHSSVAEPRHQYIYDIGTTYKEYGDEFLVNWQFTPYTLWLAGTGVFLVLFAGYVWRSDSDQAFRGRYLATALLLAAAAYNFAYLLTLSHTVLDTKLSLNHIELVMLLPLVWTWLAYVQWYTRRDTNPSRRLVRVSGIISVGLIGMVLTNPIHQLVYQSATLQQTGAFVALNLVVGPGFRLYQAYVYLLLLGSVALLTTAIIQTRGVIRRQAVSLLALSLVPGIAGGADILGLTPYTALNLAALSSVISAAAIVVTVRRFQWLDLAPVSRDHLFDAVADPIVAIMHSITYWIQTLNSMRSY